MSIQVFDGGLAQMPVYDVSQYPNQGFDCETVGQLVDIVMETGLVPAAEAREYYVKEDRYGENRTLFSTAIFNAQGEEIASLSHMMRRGQFHAKPDGKGRIWGPDAIKSTQSRDISSLINLG
jgi:hypothetical protein